MIVPQDININFQFDENLFRFRKRKLCFFLFFSDDSIDVDVPLSKKINRLNIDYSASNSNDLPPQSTFQEKYPYESDSNYYQTNEMLYTLHEER